MLSEGQTHAMLETQRRLFSLFSRVASLKIHENFIEVILRSIIATANSTSAQFVQLTKFTRTQEVHEQSHETKAQPKHIPFR